MGASSSSWTRRGRGPRSGSKGSARGPTIVAVGDSGAHIQVCPWGVTSLSLAPGVAALLPPQVRRDRTPARPRRGCRLLRASLGPGGTGAADGDPGAGHDAELV